ncbi:MAG TPA: ubiquinol-cytochrome C chaperone family protein [Alphaproteobacteria bacterium]|nr:ubiquinol-cytochrome C chaperone family protein [Alphaproteobacteria bacterium]
MPLLQRLQEIFAPSPPDPAMAALYQACVAQARQAKFYRAFGVPDTLDGRYDLLVLHAYLVMRRLGGDAERKQQLFDLMFTDVDRNLREMGVGDMGIGKRMKRMISAFYGRGQAYERALADGGDAGLQDVLARNIYGKPMPCDDAVRLAAYVRAAVARLDEQPLADVTAGHIEFPAPQA